MGSGPVRGVALVLACLVSLPEAGCGKVAATGPGTLEVTGSGKESYALSGSKGEYLGGFPTGSVRELAAGTYAVKLGGTTKVEVRAGERTTLATGTLEVTGPGKENYALSDESGGYVGGFVTGSVKELVPGSYAVRLGNTAKVKVAGGERTTLATGTLAVTGPGKENYALSDESGGYVGGFATGSVKELVPGSYAVRLGNTAKVKVAGGERTTLATGTLEVTGPGKENYALSDESGGYVGGFATGSVKELVTGSYAVKLGNTAKVKVAGGERATLATGTLEVPGTGKENYALSDESGGYVGGYATGSVKELVPGRYTVKLGENSHRVEVVAGGKATLAR